MPQSWWSDRPLGVTLSALVAAGSLALAGFGVIAVVALAQVAIDEAARLAAQLNTAVGRCRY